MRAGSWEGDGATAHWRRTCPCAACGRCSTSTTSCAGDVSPQLLETVSSDYMTRSPIPGQKRFFPNSSFCMGGFVVVAYALHIELSVYHLPADCCRVPRVCSQTNPHIVPALNIKRHVPRTVADLVESEFKHRSAPPHPGSAKHCMFGTREAHRVVAFTYAQTAGYSC